MTDQTKGNSIKLGTYNHTLEIDRKALLRHHLEIRVEYMGRADLPLCQGFQTQIARIRYITPSNWVLMNKYLAEISLGN